MQAPADVAPATEPSRVFRVDSRQDTQLWASEGAAMPHLLYWGSRLPMDTDLRAAAALAAPPLPQGALDVPEVAGWLPEPGRGFTDHPGIELRRGERRLWTQLVLQGEEPLRGGGWRFLLRDEQAGVEVVLTLEVDADTDVFSARSTVRNTGRTPLAVDALASVVVPLPRGADAVWSLGGHWSHEFRAECTPLPRRGAWLLEARTGRPSHHAYPGHVLLGAGTTASGGTAWSAQLAWSGNHRSLVQRLRLGGAQWQVGALLMPGEVLLAPGKEHVAPTAHLLRCSSGLRALALAWHRFVRTRVLPPQPRQRARRVQFNTWEATYFDHDGARLQALAEAAARVGVERFVLDDGWFRGRFNDRAGLGDWSPCPDRYPEGLAPLASHCRRLGMEFGLWVEPEGVNADSLLYQAHPEWVLQVPGGSQPLGRHQFVLDLGRRDVQDHLFDALTALLRSAPIDFLKWDMNRDFTHEAGADGRAGAFAHVRGLHALMARLREAHPTLEIESCASGGARADLGMLTHARRIWLSDCNDPLERQRMQAAALQFLPPEIIGAHVGSRLSHTTGRPATMPARTLTPWLFHFGIEADLLELPPDELEALGAAVRAYKTARELWDGVETTAIDTDDPAVTGVFAVTADRSEAWLALACVDRPRNAVPGLLTLQGLQPGTPYRVRMHDLWPAPGRGLKHGAALDRRLTIEASAELLSSVGLRRPSLWPGDVSLVHLQALPPPASG